jgi:hypothetical protein
VTQPPVSEPERTAAVIAHLVLAGLLVAAIPGTLLCSGDFIGSCLFFLAPLVLGAAVFVLIGLGRWAGGPAGTLFVADITVLVLGWSFAASSGTTLVAVGAAVALVLLALAEGTRPTDPDEKGRGDGRG